LFDAEKDVVRATALETLVDPWEVILLELNVEEYVRVVVLSVALGRFGGSELGIV